ncbi:hypothetical protein MUU72_15635 [Streptomyces sp. RS10V-4]|uniref:hypothetical protein n=1 Tax=Streptomyces rhizoryzae TaxID=2932493 RepID=UPI002002F860|nr:hypothetical protein [Streptomyces rhizoryzae]MCK7624514.1 hypothetical protein [Streptomyces rhizoryzae]
MRTQTRYITAAVGVAAVLAAAAALALKAGVWQLSVCRHAIRLSPTPRPDCPDCKGDGGRWPTLQLQPRPDWDEAPF